MNPTHTPLEKQLDAWTAVFEAQREHVSAVQGNPIVPQHYVEQQRDRMHRLHARVESIKAQGGPGAGQ